MSHPTELPCIQQFPIGQKFFRSLIAESATSQRVRGAPSESSHIQHRTRFSELVPAALLRRIKLLPAVPRAQSPFQFSLFLLWWVEDLPSVSRFQSVLVLDTRGKGSPIWFYTVGNKTPREEWIYYPTTLQFFPNHLCENNSFL